MARQDPWSMAEAVILLDATLRYKAGKITRSEAVSTVSDQLRQMALNNGQEIDEIYRNLNGISFQMASMESALAGYTIMKPATRLFEEAVLLYNTHPTEYCRVLEEAQALNTVSSKTNKEQFLEWLSSRIPSTQVPEIMALYEEIESFSTKKNILKQPLFETEDYPTVKAVLNTIESDRLFRFMHKHNMSLYYAAASHYCAFVEERGRNSFSVQYTQTEVAGNTEVMGTSSEDDSQFRGKEPKEASDLEQNTINNSQTGNASKRPETKPVEDNRPAGTADVEKTELVFVEERIKQFLKTACERNLPNITSRFIISAFPDVPPEQIKNLLIIAPWAVMRNNRWHYRELSAAKVQQQEEQKVPSKEASSKVFPSPGAAETNRTDVQNTKDNKNRVSLVSWLQKKGVDRGEAQTIDSDIRRIESWANENGIFGINLSSCSRSECADAAARLFRNFKFREFNLQEDNRLLQAISKLLAYYSDTKEHNAQATLREKSLPTRLTKLTARVIDTDNNDQKRNDRNAFVEYLKTAGYARAAANTTVSAVARVSEFCVQHGLTSKPLFDILDGNQLNEIWLKLQTNPAFEQENDSVKSRLSFAMKQYLAFRQSGRSRSFAPIQQHRTSSADSSVKRKTIHRGRVEFEEWLQAASIPAGSIKTYADSVACIGHFLLQKGLEDRDIFSIRGIARLENIRACVSGNADYAIERAGATVSLDLYALKKYIGFRKNDSSEKLDNEDAERFAAVLREYFKNGFRPNSIIDRNRFKQYYADQYGSEPTQNNDEIVAILQRVGTMQEDRIFIREGSAHSDLLDDIQAEIAHTFKNGASCIYLSELFGRHQKELAEQLQVFNQDVLKELLLSTSYDEYYASKNCFCVRGVKPNVDEDIRKRMRQSQIPMEYADIHHLLWYIPLDTIKHCLATTKDMVNVAQETYFYAPNLPVSTTELKRLAELLHGQLSQKSFVTDAELRAMIEKDCPSVAINTQSFTTWGLRDCLAVLLQNRFAFNGPIISEKGMALNMGKVFAEFSRSHDSMTFDELKEFAKSVNNGVIYWESVMEVMVRISQNEFVTKSRINFDIDAIDNVLDGFLDGDYAPIKDFGLFLHFPAVGVQWNEYVLESYVAGFSRQFSLLHSGYTATECCGGIVRKTSSIKDFQALVTDVLAHSDDWKTRDEALALLVKQGYLQRKHYARIDRILGQAKLMREQDRAEENVEI